MDEYREVTENLRANSGVLSRGLSPSGDKGKRERIGDVGIKLHGQRWHMANSPDNVLTWGEASGQIEKLIKLYWTQYPQGYVALVTSTNGDVKEIVFVKSGDAYKASQRKKHSSEMPEVALIAYHKSHVALRVLRKIDSITTAAWYVPLTAPLDLSLFIERSLKAKKGGRRTVNI